MPQANPVTFTAAPRMVGNKVSWTLCHTNPPVPPIPNCGTTKGNYPKVTLDLNTGPYTFKYEIVNDTTGKGIKFADGPLAIKKGEPFGPGKEKQIGDVNGGGNKTLTFVDRNSLPDPADPQSVTISYGLHFVDAQGNEVTSIDPDITNGGTNRQMTSDAQQFWDPGSGEFWGFMAILFLVSLLATIAARFIRFGLNPGK